MYKRWFVRRLSNGKAWWSLLGKANLTIRGVWVLSMNTLINILNKFSSTLSLYMRKIYLVYPRQGGQKQPKIILSRSGLIQSFNKQLYKRCYLLTNISYNKKLFNKFNHFTYKCYIDCAKDFFQQFQLWKMIKKDETE